MNLEELIETAMMYGRVRIHQHKDSRWSCVIEFNTVDHIALEAKSGFDCLTAKEAVAAAIRAASKVVNSMKATIAQLDKLEDKFK